jgi:AcrR family transcriptional regulator
LPFEARLTTAGPSPRTQSDRRETAEARILDAALRIIAERGTDGMTLAEVGEAAGYSRGLPAHYFGSKDGLVDALADFLVMGYRRRFAEARELRQGLEAICSRVDVYLTVAAQDLTSSRAFQVLMAEALSTGRRAASRMAELNRSSLGFFEEHLRTGIAQGEVRPDIDPASQAVLILGCVRGVIAQALLDEGQVDLPAARDEMLRTLRRALAARPASSP